MPFSVGKHQRTTEIYTLTLHDALPIWKRLPRSDSIHRPRRCGAPTSVRGTGSGRSEEHTSELQSLRHLVCRFRLENTSGQPRSTLLPYTTLFRSGNGFPEVIQFIDHGGAEHQHLFEELALDFLKARLGGIGAGGALRAQGIELDRHLGFQGGDAALDFEGLLLELGVHGADDSFEDLVIELRGWGGSVLDAREALLDLSKAIGQGLVVGLGRGFRGTADVLSEFHPHRTEGQATAEGDGKGLPYGGIATTLHIT